MNSVVDSLKTLSLKRSSPHDECEKIEPKRACFSIEELQEMLSEPYVPLEQKYGKELRRVVEKMEVDDEDEESNDEEMDVDDEESDSENEDGCFLSNIIAGTMPNVFNDCKTYEHERIMTKILF